MLSLNKLEKVIELEEQLRGQYQSQLDEKSAQIEALTSKQAELQTSVESQLGTIEKQLETITDLSAKTISNQRIEQLNRELNSRADNLQGEVTELKKRLKTLQKDLSDERAENKSLKQFDPARMKKNLDANKKKMADKTRENDTLQKLVSKTKGENAELQGKVNELEAKVEELEPEEDSTETGEDSEETGENSKKTEDAQS
jgi:chromosome segregation ATPase